MRTLYLLRHAKSCWDDPALNDFERPLNGRGRQAGRAMALHLVQAAIRPNLVLCSTARRTRETWAAIEEALPGVPALFEDGIYEAGREQLLERLRGLDDTILSAMLIGHNPGLERLAAALAAGRGDADSVARMEAKFPTGALAKLDCPVTRWTDLAEGACQLAAFVRPKDLVPTGQ